VVTFNRLAKLILLGGCVLWCDGRVVRGQVSVSLPAKPATPVVSSPASADAKGTIQVHLQVDGNLPGRLVGGNEPTGGRVARGQVVFMQKGQIVGKATADEWGRFQILGLQPGVYSVMAYGPSGVEILSVNVLPFAEDVTDGLSPLTLNLVPSEEFNKLLQTMNGQATSGADSSDATPAAGDAMPAAAAAGGGGGGGGDAGALGAALGAAAAGAGIAAGGATGSGGGGGSGGNVASPFTP